MRPGADLLHRLVAGERAERVDVGLGVEQLPEAPRAERRERVLDLERAAQALDVGLGVGADDAVEALGVERARSSRESTTRAALMVGLLCWVDARSTSS